MLAQAKCLSIGLANTLALAMDDDNMSVLDTQVSPPQ